MNKVLKIAFLLAFALIASAKSFAQNNVTATLLEAGTEEPVGYATASLTAEGSETVYKYATSNTKGVVTIESVKDGNYTFKVELMGYKTVTKEVTVKGAALNLGNIILEEDAEVLDAASVSDMANPIIVKKDTVEYNASSFLTTDNDMLQNLLAKLPGIEVGSDGSITANGENVTRIYIDGKTFFMDDPQLASQNIPAKMVEKVKVIKKKSEQAEFSGVDDGQEETVIDLSLTEGSNLNGLVGRVTAGAGHDIPSKQNPLNDWRFSGNAFLGNFAGKTQISVILNQENIGIVKCYR